MWKKISLLILFAGATTQGFGQLAAEDYSNPIESPNGYWVLTGTDTQLFGNQPGNSWDGNPGDLSVSLKWKDGLEIQHTVSCKYQWQSPPAEVQPGENIRMTGTYINSEYSTTSKMKMGLSVALDKVNISTSASHQPNEFIKIARDNKNYENETKVGLIQAPKTGNKNTELKLTVDCYAGGTKYTTTYTYGWVGTGN
jgi:hypothetical protein